MARSSHHLFYQSNHNPCAIIVMLFIIVSVQNAVDLSEYVSSGVECPQCGNVLPVPRVSVSGRQSVTCAARLRG